MRHWSRLCCIAYLFLLPTASTATPTAASASKPSVEQVNAVLATPNDWRAILGIAALFIAWSLGSMMFLSISHRRDQKSHRSEMSTIIEELMKTMGEDAAAKAALATAVQATALTLSRIEQAVTTKRRPPVKRRSKSGGSR